MIIAKCIYGTDVPFFHEFVAAEQMPFETLKVQTTRPPVQPAAGHIR
jgi:hypothetical protein